MISAILYGRNDSHGYNLHKRAALSLNCLAEGLADERDEIIFVDYNTPNDLPTFIEAIYDTLTPKTRSRLRVLRVRPEVHRRFEHRTYLHILEPHSRNIAIRRSNPHNRWVLLTNTDMVFVPMEGAPDLNSVVRDLPDGHYVLPRFELPEPLWESFPRQDPVAVIQACSRLGTALHLDEVAVSHPYMRFDAPGDFQLVPRQTLFEIFGFDERMIYGWHADSNLCKRLFLLYGETRGLEGRIKGYHCDHTRVTTQTHRPDLKLENDLEQFVYGVTDPCARHQASSWGMPDEVIEEVDFTNGPQARYVSALTESLGAPQTTAYRSDANDVRSYLCYHSEHVVPYVAANLTVYPREVRVAYVGNNPRLLALLADCLSRMGFGHPLRYLPDVMLRPLEAPEGATVVPVGRAQDLVTEHDLLIFDFGFDRSQSPRCEAPRVTDWPRDLRYGLGAVARSLEECAESCRDVFSVDPGRSVADFLIVNANHYIFAQFVAQFLLLTQTPFNTHVRKGRARVGDERLYKSHRWKYTEEAMRSFFGYDVRTGDVARITVGQCLDLTSSGCSSAYKDGHWGLMDASGTWTDGTRAEIVFAPDPAIRDDLVARVLVPEAFIGGDREPIRVVVRLEGEMLARWTLRYRYSQSTFTLVLPNRLFSDKAVVRLTFDVENPQLPALEAARSGQMTVGEDPRALGIKIQALTFVGIDRLAYAMGATIDFVAGGAGAYYLDENWTDPDQYGAWVLGPEAGIRMYLSQPPEEPVAAFFSISDVAVNDETPFLKVGIAVNGEQVDEWVLGPSRVTHTRKVSISPEVLRRRRPLRISFHAETLRSPAELKWSDDPRPLGVRLTQLRIGPAQVPTVRPATLIVFTGRGNGGALLDSNWTSPDDYGTWTIGPRSALIFRLDAPEPRPVPLRFRITDCVVGPGVPPLVVRVGVNGQTVEEWRLGPERTSQERTVLVPSETVGTSRKVTLAFQILDPRTPASLGWSADDLRPLGIRVAEVVVGDVAAPGPMARSPAPARRRSKVASRVHGLLVTMLNRLGALVGDPPT